ncbi:MAG: hypothetical protein V2A56_03430 [bacterium]
MIDIGYASAKWEKVCTNENAARKILGDPNLFELLVERLEHISAHNSVAEIPLGGTKDWHPLKGDRKNQWSITIRKPYVICLAAAGEFETDENESVKPNTVTALEVVFVGDYH